jgi:hypothetical protein
MRSAPKGGTCGPASLSDVALEVSLEVNSVHVDEV